MTGTGTETLTAALRRLADEHASGLLAVATEGQDVVLELADGVPVGIGPTTETGGRIGRDASSSLVAAAVVDELVDRTVAAIVGGGGDWTWDVDSDVPLMPVPPGLAAELSRRAVDAAQALAQLPPERVLSPGRALPVHGEVGDVLACFDGERTLEEVAEAAGLTLPAAATHAAALVRAGVLATGLEDVSPLSWGDAVASTAPEDEDEDEDDEPELWVMDEPEPEPEPEPDTPDAPAATAPEPAAQHRVAEEPVQRSDEEPAGPEPTGPEPTASEPPAAAAAADEWDDTGWLDDLEPGGDDDQPPVLGEESGADTRASLSAMLSDLQPRDDEPRRSTSPAPEPTRAPTPDEEAERPGRPAADAGQRKEPRAEPGEVAEFLRELSRLALDED